MIAQLIFLFSLTIFTAVVTVDACSPTPLTDRTYFLFTADILVMIVSFGVAFG